MKRAQIWEPKRPRLSLSSATFQLSGLELWDLNFVFNEIMCVGEGHKSSFLMILLESNMFIIGTVQHQRRLLLYIEILSYRKYR